MKPKVLAAGVMAAMLALTGCEDPKKMPGTEAKIFDVDAIINATDLTSAQKAEMLAQIGEALATPVGFMYADEVLTQALKLDRQNPRAQLYKHIVAPPMQLKGAIRGIRPLVGKMSRSSQENFALMASDLGRNHSLHNFMVDGPPNITTEAQAQELLDKVYGEQDKLRLFVRGDFKRNILKISPVIVAGTDSGYLATCQVTPFNKRDGYHGKYQLAACPWHKSSEVTIDSADIEVLQHAFAGVQIATIMATSYDLTGGVLYEQYAQNRGTVADSVRFIRGLPSAGKLRSNSSIRLIHSMGSDAYAGAQWAQRYQDRLCPKGHYKMNRPGRLVSGGLCVQDLPDPAAPKADTVLRVFAAALAGTSTEIGIRDQKVFAVELSKDPNFDYRAQAQVFAPITNPVADLKTLLPTYFDNCGQPLNVGESTLGGVLPAGNANDVLARMGAFGKNCNR